MSPGILSLAAFGIFGSAAWARSNATSSLSRDPPARCGHRGAPIRALLLGRVEGRLVARDKRSRPVGLILEDLRLEVRGEVARPLHRHDLPLEILPCRLEILQVADPHVPVARLVELVRPIDDHGPAGVGGDDDVGLRIVLQRRGLEHDPPGRDLDGGLAQPKPDGHEGHLAVDIVASPRLEEEVDAPQRAVGLVLRDVGDRGTGGPAGDGHDGAAEVVHFQDFLHQIELPRHRADGGMLLEVVTSGLGVVVVVLQEVVQRRECPAEHLQGIAQVAVVVPGGEEDALLEDGLGVVRGIRSLDLPRAQGLEDVVELGGLRGQGRVALAARHPDGAPVHELHVEGKGVGSQGPQVREVPGVEVPAPRPLAHPLHRQVVDIDQDHLRPLDRGRHHAGVQVEELELQAAGRSRQHQEAHDGDGAEGDGPLREFFGHLHGI